MNQVSSHLTIYHNKPKEVSGMTGEILIAATMAYVMALIAIAVHRKGRVK